LQAQEVLGREGGLDIGKVMELSISPVTPVVRLLTVKWFISTTPFWGEKGWRKNEKDYVAQ